MTSTPVHRADATAPANAASVVPQKMIAQVIRPERYGDPLKAFKEEEVDVPAELRPDEVLDRPDRC